MRKVIIPKDAKPPADWLNKANKLTAELIAAKTEAERIGIIEKNEGLWRDNHIRDWLLALFHSKCWYTEAQEAVSAYHVDHYRPKGRVSDFDKSIVSDGYWWLAFEWSNYRICGQLINVKKSDHFPLNETQRATLDKSGSLKLEAPLLIDPTTDDARLVSFELDEDGCRATYIAEADEADIARVDKTIEILGLNRLDRLNQKRADIWTKCKKHIDDYNAASKDPQSIKVILQDKAVGYIKEMIEYKSELSSVAYACVFKEAPLPLRAKVLG